jgi:Sulfotransferase family
MVTRIKCLIILSEKSSGSSALQSRLLRIPQVHGIAWTRHFESETLYWTKAASVLGCPQVKMHQSEVPIPRERARRELITLLERNLGEYVPPTSDRDLIFEGWRLLCRQFGPVFCEKSPHHLVQWSALELILECQKRQPDIDFLLIGLVRNPMDTIYSQFRRWGARPERLQQQWQVAYENLQALKERCGERLVVLRYEDIVRSEAALDPIFRFCGAQAEEVVPTSFHAGSLAKWKRDRRFGFVPDESLVALARRYGYEEDELRNQGWVGWPALREFACMTHAAKSFAKRVVAQRRWHLPR